jgi:glycerophosphoryl diester phosphodiesterase
MYGQLLWWMFFYLMTPRDRILTPFGKVPLRSGQEGQQKKFHHGYPMISAHRGASTLAPENTLAAFAKAIELGADFIELDVRTTADGEQICLHDASLKRTTGWNEDVKSVSVRKVKELSAGHSFGDKFAGEKIPSLGEVCELVAGINELESKNVRLYVDCKDIRPAEVVRILQRYGLLDSAVFYGTVNILSEIGEISGHARLMPRYPGREGVESLVTLLHPFAFDVAWPDVNSDLVAQCHIKGIKVFSDLLDEYDDSVQYRKAMDLNIDLIQTDDVSSVIRSISDRQEKLHNEKN